MKKKNLKLPTTASESYLVSFYDRTGRNLIEIVDFLDRKSVDVAIASRGSKIKAEIFKYGWCSQGLVGDW